MREFINIVESATPLRLFHGTLEQYLPTIGEHGLDPTRTMSGLSAIYLTNDPALAAEYAASAAIKHRSGNWVVLEVDPSKLDLSAMGPDDFELAEILADAEDEREWSAVPWQESLQLCSQAAYHGHIPPEAFSI